MFVKSNCTSLTVQKSLNLKVYVKSNCTSLIGQINSMLNVERRI
jgi:hypothetical protein